MKQLPPPESCFACLEGRDALVPVGRLEEVLPTF